MKCEIERHDADDIQLIRVCGNVDYLDCTLLSEALAPLREDCAKIVVDLSEVKMLDSRAVHVMLSACRDAADLGKEVRISSASNGVERVLRMCGVESHLGLDPEPEPIVDWVEHDGTELRKQDWKMSESIAYAHADLMPALRDVVISSALEEGLDADAVIDIHAATTEALANALRYGAPDGENSRITIRGFCCPKAFVVEVQDEGPGIGTDVLEQASNPNNHKHLGLKIMLRAMDEVEFMRHDGHSVVRMLKWR